MVPYDLELMSGIRLMLELCLATLPPEQERLLSRVYFEGVSLLQASHQCRDIPLAEARVLLARAQLLMGPSEGATAEHRERLSLLPAEERRLYERVFLVGQSLEQAAACARDIPYATAHAMHARALRGLRCLIEEDPRFSPISEGFLGLRQP